MDYVKNIGMPAGAARALSLWVLLAGLVLWSNAALAQTLYVYSPKDGYLNLRAGPSTQYEIVQRMYNGAQVRVLGAAGDWLNVRHEAGARGWAHKRYLIATRPGATRKKPTPKPKASTTVPEGHCTIVIASRQTLRETRDFVRDTGYRPEDLEYYESANGWIAISVGTFENPTARANLADWQARNLIPQDAFCSGGRKFLRKLPAAMVMSSVDPEPPQPLRSDPPLPEPPKPRVQTNPQPQVQPQDQSGVIGGVYLSGQLITNAPTSGTSTFGAARRYQCTVICTNSAVVAGTGRLGDTRQDVLAEIKATSLPNARQYAILSASQVCEAVGLYRPAGHGAFCN